MEDTELITRIQEGEHELFDRLLEKYQRPVYSFIYSMAGNRTETDDLFQDVFLKAAANIKKYRHDNRFSGWLMRIAKNTLIDARRKDAREKTVSLDAPVNTESGRETALGELIPGTGDTPDRSLEKRELSRILRKGLDSISPEQREVFLLREQSGLSFKEIAKVLGCSINTSLGRMHYAVKGLRKIIPRSILEE